MALQDVFKNFKSIKDGDVAAIAAENGFFFLNVK
jgi:hypothetical protein